MRNSNKSMGKFSDDNFKSLLNEQYADMRRRKSSQVELDYNRSKLHESVQAELEDKILDIIVENVRSMSSEIDNTIDRYSKKYSYKLGLTKSSLNESLTREYLSNVKPELYTIIESVLSGIDRGYLTEGNLMDAVEGDKRLGGDLDRPLGKMQPSDVAKLIKLIKSSGKWEIFVRDVAEFLEQEGVLKGDPQENESMIDAEMSEPKGFLDNNDPNSTLSEFVDYVSNL